MYTAQQIIDENQIHRQDVQDAINVCKAILNLKARNHDLDKNDPRKAQILANALNDDRYWDEWDKIHLNTQKHHIPCFRNNPNRDCFDILEMICDGCVANLRREGEEKTREQEMEFYKEQGFSEEECIVMTNTFLKIQHLIQLKEE